MAIDSSCYEYSSILHLDPIKNECNKYIKLLMNINCKQLLKFVSNYLRKNHKRISTFEFDLMTWKHFQKQKKTMNIYITVVHWIVILYINLVYFARLGFNCFPSVNKCILIDIWEHDRMIMQNLNNEIVNN